jgi:GDP-D-mannose 3',5'-epimerase
MKKALVLGSSGFIGSNLVAKLQSEEVFVVGVDMDYPKYSNPDIFIRFDLREPLNTLYGKGQFDEAYVLACLMGGMGFIGDEKKHGYDIGIGSTQIICNTIEYLRGSSTKVFYSSSACVYNQLSQTQIESCSLKESDAIPAFPDLLYGWQKLYAEKMFEASGLDVRIARFHNIFGKWGTYDGGKEKAPAALIRKVVNAKDGDEIEVWGTGLQARSFLHIDECLEGVERLMKSEYRNPINIGSDEMVSINQLAQMVIDISGKRLSIKNVPGNVGVMGRNSDNTLIEKEIGWRPSKSLRSGIEKTYSWIESEINKK